MVPPTQKQDSGLTGGGVNPAGSLLFSVVVPTCHRNDMLAECLDALAPGAQSLAADRYEVIVSDDGSKSTAEEMISARYPWARWLSGPRRGPAANRNHGAKSARGQWLVFTDDDCLPDKGFLAAFEGEIVKTKASVLEGKTAPTGIRDRVDMECPENTTGGYLWSCNMAIRREIFFEMEGFDTGFPGAAMEDVDLRERLKNAGQEIRFVPGALVLHPWRVKKGKVFWRMHSQSRVYFIRKHPDKAGELTFPSLARELAIRIKQGLGPAWACRGRGWPREIGLTFYSVWTVMSLARSHPAPPAKGGGG